MTYSSWKIRENGLKRIRLNFNSAILQYSPDNYRIFQLSKEATLTNDISKSVANNNNLSYQEDTIENAILKSSSIRHRKLSKIFSNETIMPKVGDNYNYILGIKGRPNKFYVENCRVINTTCMEEFSTNTNGTDTKCLPNKCFGGELTFSILNESIIQLDIVRGDIQKSLYIKNIFLNKSSNEIYDFYIRISNDSDDLIYYPDDDKEFYRTIGGKLRIPLQLLFDINQNNNFLKDFFDSILIFLFRKTCEGPIEVCIRNNLLSQNIESFKNELKDRISLSKFSNFIKSKILESIELITEFSNLADYVSQCFDVIQELFNSSSYIVDSGFLQSKKSSFRGELRGRPIYSRLPSSNFGYNTSGLEENIIFLEDINSRFSLENIDSGQIVVANDYSEGYKYIPRLISSYRERISLGLPEKITDTYDKDQIYSPKDPESWKKLESSELPPVPVTKWVIEASDKFLIESKEKIDRFFDEYLNPDTCFSESLDWLAQHVGLNDSIYSSYESDSIKRILIKNALGWEDSRLDFEVTFPNPLPDGSFTKVYKTIKGKVLDDLPFNNGQWSNTNFSDGNYIKYNILKGVVFDQDIFSSNQDDDNLILFEKKLVPEIKKVIFADESYIYLDSELSAEYEYISVRFYGDLLPDFISANKKYFVRKFYENRYEVYSEFGDLVPTESFNIESDIFIENQFKVSTESIHSIIYNKNDWEGIYQSKGSKIGLAFALSLPLKRSNKFVHSHVLEELKQSDAINKVYSVKSGLRANELQEKSPLLRPWERPFLQVGNEFGNFSNQLISDISEVREEKDSYDLIFRLPYYYNRNGKTWNHVLSVKDNWIPVNVNTRVQYPYLASELWSVGDAFFELEIDG